MYLGETLVITPFKYKFFVLFLVSSSKVLSFSSGKVEVFELTPLHSPPAEEHSRSLRHEQLIIAQPVLLEHFKISSKAFSAMSLSVVIGNKIDTEIIQTPIS